MVLKSNGGTRNTRGHLRIEGSFLGIAISRCELEDAAVMLHVYCVRGGGYVPTFWYGPF